MRKKIVAGNWKMNLSPGEATALFMALNELPKYDAEMIVFPPLVYVQELNRVRTSAVHLGVQNFYPIESGAFTGEVSIAQVKNVGASYALVGHSERRSVFGESGEMLRAKVNACLFHEMTPIVCCGEPLVIREANEEFSFVKDQLEECLFHLSGEQLTKTIIAYEPVWAIGTGKTASSEQAEAMHKEIRSWIAEKYGTEIANSISILYGGSCNASNAEELFKCENVDGGLIGGASLDVGAFEAILKAI